MASVQALGPRSAARAAALARYQIIDTPREAGFDRITRLAQRMFDVPVALISFLDGDRLWFKSAAGSDVAQVPADHGLNQMAIAKGAPWCVPDLTADPRTAANPYVAGAPGLRFYAGAPLLTPEGIAIGTVCLVDTAARAPLDGAALAQLADLAALAMELVEHRRTTRLAAKLIGLATRAPDFDRAADATMAAVCAATGAMIALVWHRLPGMDRAMPLGGHAAPPLTIPSYIEPVLRQAVTGVNSIVGHVLATGEAVAIADVTDPDALARFPLLSSMVVPGVRAKIAVALDLGEARYVLTLALGEGHQDLDALVRLLGDLGPALHPLLRRHADQVEAHLLRRVVEASDDAVIITDTQPSMTQPPRILYVNQAFERLTGFAADEVAGRTADMMYGPEIVTEDVLRLRASMIAGRPARSELSFATKDGGGVWVGLATAPLPDQVGWVGRWVTVARDITAQRREAARVAASEAAFRALFQNNPIAMWIVDLATGRFLQVNTAAVDSYGWSVAQFQAMTLADLHRPDDPARRSQAALGGVERRVTGPWRHRDADGIERHVQLVAHHFEDAAGRQALIAVWDITEQIEIEAENAATAQALLAQTEKLRAQTEQLRQAQDLARLGTWSCTGDTREVHWSPELFRMLGLDATARDASEVSVMGLVHKDDREAMTTAFVRTLQTGVPMAIDIRALKPNGAVAHLRLGGKRRVRPDGVPMIDGYCQDVTERREAEAALLHSEKLRTMGQLTGGIAHDFNNLLTVISVSLEMAEEAVATGEPVVELIEAARGATDRATALTGQLLSYARRQPLRAAALDLAQFLPGLIGLVGRTLGEGHAVVLDTAAAVPPVLADRAQLETALINLMLNARDACPGGGEIAITLARAAAPEGLDLAPGAYGVLAVRDRGAGMEDWVRARAFEPFFSTKPSGKGTGLGLSMVLGFARQSGGTAVIDSVAGQGTTVRLYLPLAPEAVAPAAEAAPRAPVADAASAPPPAEAAPLVLVVAERASARVDLIALCQDAGLVTIGSDTAEAAAAVLRGGTRVDLVVLDQGADARWIEAARALPAQVVAARIGPGDSGPTLERLGDATHRAPAPTTQAMHRLAEALRRRAATERGGAA